MRIRYIVCVVLAALVLPCAGAQQGEPLRRNLQFQQLSTDDGLSHEMVNDIVQDVDGYLWIATQEGLGRFDGREVVTFGHLRTDETTLANDFVRTLFRDSRDRLWIGTEAGVDRYLGSQAGFVRASFPGMDTGAALDQSIRAIAESPRGELWFATAGGGLVRVDESTSSFDVLGTGSTPALPANDVLSLEFTRDGALWIGTEGAGVVRYDPVRDEVSVPEGLEIIAGEAVRALLEDSRGRLWIGTDGAGVLRYDTTRGTLDRWRTDADGQGGLPSDRIRDILEDAAGTLWFATDGGIAEWRRDAERFAVYGHLEGDTRTLASDRTNTLFSDASGVLWVGTWNGVSRWNRVSDVFSYLLAADGRLPGDWVNSVDEDSAGVLWIATYGDGLGSLDPVTGETRFYRFDEDDPASLPDDRVMVVHVDREDRVWVGTRAAGLARLDRTSGRFTRLAHDPDDPQSISGNAITSIHHDSRGDLWVGTFGAGLDRLPGARGDRFERFAADPAREEALGGDRVLTIAEAPNGGIWLGMEGTGLDHFDPETGRFSHVRRLSLSGEADAVELDTVTDLRFASDGALWIGTLGRGLLRWSDADRRGDRSRARIFDKAQGLPADAIYGIVEAADGAIWASSNRGLTRLDPERGATRQFDDRNGLRDSEFNGARLRSASGHLLFGGPEGLVRFRPDELPFNDRPPPVVASASSRTDLLATTRSGAAAPVVEIGYLNPFLAFDFVALDFVSPDKNQYRYRMAGFDPDWVPAGTFRRATYTNLPAGRYTFEVQASNNDGVWNETPARFDVIAVPAPWNSLWAYAFYVLTALTAVGLYLRAQREKLARESRQRVLLEEQVEQRTRELARSNRDLHRMNERLEEAAVTDSLTNLRNRRYADQFLANDIAKFERDQLKRAEEIEKQEETPSPRSMFLMMIDLDGFKAINDHFGHHAGDRALVQVRDLLLAACRSSDTIVRWGGDEFLISGTTMDYGDVKILAERIRDAITNHAFEVGSGREAHLSASIGIAPYPLVPDRYSFCSWELVSAVADQAAYIAKASARDAWVSLVGTRTLEPEMLTGLSDHVADMISEGHLTLETNVDAPLRTANGSMVKLDR